MSERQKIPDPKTRKRSHTVLIAFLPVLAQVAFFFFIARWAEGAGSGAGMLGLYSFIVLLVAIPVTMVINIVVATYSGGMHFFWMLLVAIAIAVLLPIVFGSLLLIA